MHEEIGPARTTVAEIARRAGVERLTVYNNFPDEYELFAACQAHFFAKHPAPDLSPVLAIANPGERLEAVLQRLYRWYRRTEAMSANVRRDREIVPALDSLMAHTTDVRAAALADALTDGFGERGSRRRDVRALLAVALEFSTWRRLAREGLSDPAAARVMAKAVRTAVREA